MESEQQSNAHNGKGVFQKPGGSIQRRDAPRHPPDAEGNGQEPQVSAMGDRHGCLFARLNGDRELTAFGS
jgi:hypothetical protein